MLYFLFTLLRSPFSVEIGPLELKRKCVFFFFFARFAFVSLCFESFFLSPLNKFEVIIVTYVFSCFLKRIRQMLVFLFTYDDHLNLKYLCSICYIYTIVDSSFIKQKEKLY